MLSDSKSAGDPPDILAPVRLCPYGAINIFLVRGVALFLKTLSQHAVLRYCPVQSQITQKDDFLFQMKGEATWNFRKLQDKNGREVFITAQSSNGVVYSASIVSYYMTLIAILLHFNE